MRAKSIVTILFVSAIIIAALGDAIISRAEDTWIAYLPFTSRTRTLTVCSAYEPESLYMYYGGYMSLTTAAVLSAIYDGPFDSLSYAYQPVILTKMPSLADGDTVIEAVSVTSGAQVVDNYGDVVTLTAGSWVRPAGCRSDDCAIIYDGTSPLMMDKMAVTFHMLPNLKWADGAQLTAADSVYSYNLEASPDTPSSKYTFDRTEAYVAIDDTTVIWWGVPGYLDDFYMLNFWTPLPEHIWGAYSAAELLTAEISNILPMGYGPYIIDEWVIGSHIELHKNPYYFRASEGLPRFTNLTIRFITNDTVTVLDNLLTGECDIADETLTSSIVNELINYDQLGQLQAIFSIGTTWEHLDFGIQHISYDDGYDGGIQDRVDYFSDVRTRQAIAYCLDRQTAVDDTLYGQSIVLDTYLPPSHPLYDATAAHYDFDVTAGSALLDQVGWVDHDANPATARIAQNVAGVPNGTPLEFSMETTTATFRMQYTQILADSLAQCGIKANLNYLPASEFFADGPDGILFGRKFDVGFFAWLNGVIPPLELYTSFYVPGDPAKTWLPIMEPQAGLQPFTYGWGGQNETGYYNPVYDQVYETAVSLLPGEGGFATAHQQAQNILSNDLPVIPLFPRIKLAAAGTHVSGFSLNPTSASYLWNIENIDIVP